MSASLVSRRLGDSAITLTATVRVVSSTGLPSSVTVAEIENMPAVKSVASKLNLLPSKVSSGAFSTLPIQAAVSHSSTWESEVFRSL